MVQFSHSNNRSNPGRLVDRTIRQVIDSVVDEHQAELRELRISVECDIDWQVSDLVCHPLAEVYLTDLLRSSIAHSCLENQLTISACHTIRGIEIEIADTNSISDDQPRSAFSRCRHWAPRAHRDTVKRSLSATSPDVYHTRCPQGGEAWTLVLNQRLAQVKAA